MKIIKTLIKKSLRRFNKKLIYVRKNTVSGTDLNEDLRVLIPTKNPVVLDIGANCGQTIEAMRRLFQAPNIGSTPLTGDCQYSSNSSTS